MKIILEVFFENNKFRKNSNEKKENFCWNIQLFSLSQNFCGS